MDLFDAATAPEGKAARRITRAINLLVTLERLVKPIPGLSKRFDLATRRATTPEETALCLRIADQLEDTKRTYLALVKEGRATLPGNIDFRPSLTGKARKKK